MAVARIASRWSREASGEGPVDLSVDGDDHGYEAAGASNSRWREGQQRGVDMRHRASIHPEQPHPVEQGLREVLGAAVQPGASLSVELSSFPRLPLLLELALLRVCHEVVSSALGSAASVRLHGSCDGNRAAVSIEGDGWGPVSGSSLLRRLQPTLERCGGRVLLQGTGTSMRVLLHLPV